MQSIEPLDMCDSDAFASGVELIDQACCDQAGGGCTDGSPTECDAKCAVVYVDFYERCRSMLVASVVSQVHMRAFDQLYTTCSEQLSVEDLLWVAINCTKTY